MRVVKIVGLALAAVIVVVLVAAAFLVATFDANRHKDTLVELVRERTGRTLAIGGDIELSLFPRLAVSVDDVRLSGPDGKSEFAAIDALDLAVEVLPLLKGELRIDEIRAERPVVHYVRDKAGRSSLDGLGVPAGAEGESGDAGESDAAAGDGRDLVFDVQRVEVVDGKLVVRDAQAGRSGELAGLSLSVGHLAQGHSAPWSLAGRFDFSQPAAQGKLDMAGELELGGSKVAVRDLKLQLDMLPPAGQDSGLRLSAGGEIVVDNDAGTTVATLVGTLDGAPFRTHVELPREAPTRFDLTMAKLDVDRLLALAAAPKPAGGPKEGQDGKAATKGDRQEVDLSFARGLRLEGKVHVDELRAAGLSLSQLDATIRGDGKVLAVAPLSARGYGGGVEGSVRIDGAANGIAVRQTFTDLAVGDLLRDLTGKDVVDGRGSLRLDLNARGATVGALKRALAGSAALSLRNGAVKGFDLGRLLREGQALLAGGGVAEVGPVFNPADRTEIAELDASFRVANGVARNDDLDARNALLQLRGGGTIDVVNNRLDYIVRATAADTEQARTQLAKLQGITVPVSVSGPLEAPAARVVWSEVAGEAARRALADRLKKSLGGDSADKPAPAKPEDALKEELGRRLQDLLR